MNKLKLSDGEKIIISMLSDIHNEMNIDGQLNVKRVLDAMFGGHLWSLSWDYPGLFNVKEDDPQEVKETVDIIDMWSFIEHSFARLNDADKDLVRAANFGHDPEFSGFDGNNENHYGIAHHLIKEMGRWENFKGRYLNSHSRRVDGYLKMFVIFDSIRNNLGMRPNPAMTAQELVTIFEAVYPKKANANAPES
ncbi:YfbU family protein [Salipiger marinus]|uniref:YfbU family protein n=1 Tax=Salipiger marinus TaxID=555512 RepID=UPI002D0DC74E|nr:YfbU family protein [Salipiger manganoxidans]MEB3421772.1 YfbU family protein [Salipiger manganoxidans]